MSNDKPETAPAANEFQPVAGGVIPPKPLPPRTIAAQSQAWNSAAKIVILGAALAMLLVLVGISLFVHPEHLRDLLWASVSIVAYLAGSGEFARKDDK